MSRQTDVCQEFVKADLSTRNRTTGNYILISWLWDAVWREACFEFTEDIEKLKHNVFCVCKDFEERVGHKPPQSFVDHWNTILEPKKLTNVAQLDRVCAFA